MGNERGERTLFFLGLTASLLGLALIYSATHYDEALHSLVWKQAAALGVGVVLCLLLWQIHLRELVERAWWLLAVGNLGFLLLLVPFGNEDGTGNKSWIALPGGHFNLQPAEFGKLLFLLLLALQLTRLREEGGLNRLRSVLALLAHVGGVCGLLYLVSGDLGMAAIYLGLYFGMLWGAGVHPLWLGGEVAVGVGGLVLLWPRLPEYIRLRVQVVLDHDLDPLGKGFQQGRSLLALGSGKLTGQGYLQGIQTQSTSPAALPARHTDFLFAAAGEELGLVGCLLILGLLSAIVFRCIWLAKTSRDPFFTAVASGTAAMFATQTILNVAMCLYAAPVVGVTLPFFSYGGSSLVASFGAVGVLGALKRN